MLSPAALNATVEDADVVPFPDVERGAALAQAAAGSAAVAARGVIPESG